MISSEKGSVVSIYLYPQRRAEAVAVASVEAILNQGLKGDQGRAAHRQVTLLSLEAWS